LKKSHAAIKHRAKLRAQICHQLVLCGSDANALDHNGDAALLVACQEKAPFSVIKCLVGAGAKVNVTSHLDNHMDTPIIEACRQGNFSLVEYLLSVGM
jgi:ankyrin repeat protein